MTTSLPAAPRLLRPDGRTPVFCLLLALCASCGMPHDPEGSLERIRGRTLRVGVSAAPPWVVEDTEPRGIEPELARQFADRLDAEVEWVQAPESRLAELLDQGRIHLAIAGYDDNTPWTTHGGMTQPYVKWNGKRHVMLTQPGENRLLLELDRFLQSQRGAALEELLEEERR
jgi:ABC-type amino acid transport substrate-binding protein